MIRYILYYILTYEVGTSDIEYLAVVDQRVACTLRDIRQPIVLRTARTGGHVYLDVLTFSSK